MDYALLRNGFPSFLERGKHQANGEGVYFTTNESHVTL